MVNENIIFYLNNLLFLKLNRRNFIYIKKIIVIICVEKYKVYIKTLTHAFH